MRLLRATWSEPSLPDWEKQLCRCSTSYAFCYLGAEKEAVDYLHGQLMNSQSLSGQTCRAPCPRWCTRPGEGGQRGARNWRMRREGCCWVTRKGLWMMVKSCPKRRRVRLIVQRLGRVTLVCPRVGRVQPPGLPGVHQEGLQVHLEGHPEHQGGHHRHQQRLQEETSGAPSAQALVQSFHSG